MQAYTGFAQVYDIFMDNVPYDEWTEYLAGLLKEYGIEDGLILELGCGTGSVTRRLADKGYDMIGIDNSEEMLEIARYKEYNEYETISYDEDEETESLSDYSGSFSEHSDPLTEYSDEARKASKPMNRILYLEQDMRSFELYGTVSAVVSICDSMNYITSEEDLLSVFKLVNNYLDPGGIFIFDMNTEYKYKNILADNTIAENREECSFIWENYYYEDKKINQYDVTIFVKLEDSDNEVDSDNEEDSDNGDDYNTDEYEEEDSSPNNLYERFQETHYQKAYTLETVKKLLQDAGMEFVAVYDAFTHNTPNEKSERVYFIAKEKYQETKKYL